LFDFKKRKKSPFAILDFEKNVFSNYDQNSALFSVDPDRLQGACGLVCARLALISLKSPQSYQHNSTARIRRNTLALHAYLDVQGRLKVNLLLYGQKDNNRSDISSRCGSVHQRRIWKGRI